MNAGQQQEYRELAERLSYFGLEGRAQGAITALLAEVERLTVALHDDAATKLGDAMLEAARYRRERDAKTAFVANSIAALNESGLLLREVTAERDALAAELASYKRNAAYIAACVDSDGCYRP